MVLSNRFKLNINKCKIISFFRAKEHNIIRFDYKINDVSIERVDTINDLGLILNKKMNFNDDCTFIISKAKLMAGFVKRQMSELRDMEVLKSLCFFSAISTRILYSSLVKHKS